MRLKEPGGRWVRVGSAVQVEVEFGLPGSWELPGSSFKTSSSALSSAEPMRSLSRDPRREGCTNCAAMAAWRRLHRALREALFAILIVDPSKIFINIPGMTFGKTPDGCPFLKGGKWHTVFVRSLSDRRG
jgi:hypothetical protein